LSDRQLPWDCDWIVKKAICAIRLPAQEDVEQLARLGVTLMVTVAVEPYADPVRQWCVDAGMRHLRYDVADMEPPELDQIRDFVAETQYELERQGRVAVHCLGGIGRTGTMIAGYLVAQGKSHKAAIDHVRRRRPGSIQTVGQEIAIARFATEMRET